MDLRLAECDQEVLPAGATMSAPSSGPNRWRTPPSRLISTM
ncbi:hypothetical protein [Nonomuraea recticatena]